MEKPLKNKPPFPKTGLDYVIFIPALLTTIFGMLLTIMAALNFFSVILGPLIKGKQIVDVAWQIWVVSIMVLVVGLGFTKGITKRKRDKSVFKAIFFGLGGLLTIYIGMTYRNWQTTTEILIQLFIILIGTLSFYYVYRYLNGNQKLGT